MASYITTLYNYVHVCKVYILESAQAIWMFVSITACYLLLVRCSSVHRVPDIYNNTVESPNEAMGPLGDQGSFVLCMELGRKYFWTSSCIINLQCVLFGRIYYWNFYAPFSANSVYPADLSGSCIYAYTIDPNYQGSIIHA